MLTIIVHEKGGRAQRIPMDRDPFTVGREVGNDLVLDRANISKHHLRLRRHEGRVEVIDLESTNGTYVNGRKVTTPVALRRSDRVYAGDYILMLEGDDPAISPREATDLSLPGKDGEPMRRSVALPAGGVGTTGDTLDTLLDDDSGVLTSARRVAPPGVESSYVDEAATRILQTVLINVSGLDPARSKFIDENDRDEALSLVDGLIAQMQSTQEIESSAVADQLRAQLSRELLELGPLGDLLDDPSVHAIHVVGSAPVRVVRNASTAPTAILRDRRFSGDRALGLAIARLARKWGFLVEGAQILEGRVDHGFQMYALLSPSQAEHPVLSLIRTHTDAQSLEALVRESVLSDGMRELLAAAIRGCCRVLVCASGGTNLERFMGALIQEVPDELRVVCVSDTGRLGHNRTGWACVRRMSDPSDGMSLSDVIGVLLRGGVDLLVSQRCRHEDAAAVVDALAGATKGALVSLWGIDAAHALWRLSGLSTVASGAVGELTTSLGRSVDLIVRLGVGVSHESMQVTEILEPRVREGGELVYFPIFRAAPIQGGGVEFQPTGTVPSCVAQLVGQGIAIPRHVFDRGDEASA